MGIILDFLKGKALAIAGTVIAILLAYVLFLELRNSYLKDENVKLEMVKKLQEDDIKNLTALNKKNLLEYEQDKKNFQKMLLVREERYKKQLHTAKQISIIEEGIKNVKKEDDGAVAPVLVDTLNRLHDLQQNSN